MAERRMFAKTIIDSDAFIDMPLSTQALYFHLSMRADDDGFLNNPKKIQRMVGCSDDDLKILIGKRFIIPFESGVVVIKHWRIHNYIRSDRYKETVYKEEKNQLYLKENGSYTLSKEEAVPALEDDVIPFGIPDDNQLVYQMDTQVRLGKDSIGKDNKNTDNETKTAKKKKTLNELLNEYALHDEVKDALLDFIEMRRAKKRPLTERALKMVINKLRDLSTDKQTQVDIINQSILHNWDTVYELKKDYYKPQQQHVSSADNDPWKELDSLDIV